MKSYGWKCPIVKHQEFWDSYIFRSTFCKFASFSRKSCAAQIALRSQSKVFSSSCWRPGNERVTWQASCETGFKPRVRKSVLSCVERSSKQQTTVCSVSAFTSPKQEGWRGGGMMRRREVSEKHLRESVKTSQSVRGRWRLSVDSAVGVLNVLIGPLNTQVEPPRGEQRSCVSGPWGALRDLRLSDRDVMGRRRRRNRKWSLSLVLLNLWNFSESKNEKNNQIKVEPRRQLTKWLCDRLHLTHSQILVH